MTASNRAGFETLGNKTSIEDRGIDRGGRRFAAGPAGRWIPDNVLASGPDIFEGNGRAR